MTDQIDDDSGADLEEEISKSEVALLPSETADSADLVAKAIPADILERYEVHSYRNAAVILSEARHEELHYTI